MYHHNPHYFPKNPRALYFAAPTRSSNSPQSTIAAYFNTARAHRLIPRVTRQTAKSVYDKHKTIVIGCAVVLACVVLFGMVLKICFFYGDRIWNQIKEKEMGMEGLVEPLVQESQETTTTTLKELRGYRWDDDNSRP
ncbi:Protein CBG26519 [Caenorhabditis briggsae]|uniref:Uncharacterized protein n=2 Tax=Caenorhabditis briggsae TaxID=6238 RepID=A0AAE9AEU0_CAEBR|nr:Protein CBG26519 [Caenorhabditis briggsae]ULT97843.1 hypothetical protein L3Y34_005584 [Caenorhabditis briggsae]CAR99882.1 Protein CBG26519 [Caenorhabditis briggsae]